MLGCFPRSHIRLHALAISLEYIAMNEQKVSSNYLLGIISQDYKAPIEKSLSPADALFVFQSRVIRKIVKKRINRSRISHYQYYTNQKWGDPHNYDLMINTGNMTFAMACDIIVHLYQIKHKTL